MHVHRHPELLDRLAASHALGTLRGHARRRFERHAREHAEVRARVLLWRERLASLTELQAAVAPDPQLWKRVENLLDAEAATQRRAQASPTPLATPTAPGWWQSLSLWRGGAVAAGVLALACALLLVQSGSQRREELAHLEAARTQSAQLQAQLDDARRHAQEVRAVAVLADAQARPVLVASLDPATHQLQVQRVGDYHEPPDRSLQLWAVAPSGGVRSLGVLERGQGLPAPAVVADAGPIVALAVSLEPAGGVPSERGPTGPVLFKGAWNAPG